MFWIILWVFATLFLWMFAFARFDKGHMRIGTWLLLSSLWVVMAPLVGLIISISVRNHEFWSWPLK
jgi:hypothetical protein